MYTESWGYFSPWFNSHHTVFPCENSKNSNAVSSFGTEFKLLVLYYLILCMLKNRGLSPGVLTKLPLVRTPLVARWDIN